MATSKMKLSELEHIDWRKASFKQTCHQCRTTFDRRPNFLAHEPCFLSTPFHRPQFTLAPFACTHCSAVFRRLSDLRSHMQKQHLHEDSWRCLHCSQGWPDRPSLFSHLIRRHYTAPCPVAGCLKRPNGWHNLAAHLKIHHDLTADPCPQCDKVILPLDQASSNRHRQTMLCRCHAVSVAAAAAAAIMAVPTTGATATVAASDAK